MESRICIFLLKTKFIPVALMLTIPALLFGNMPVFADDELEESEQFIRPKIERRDVKEAKIDTEDFEIGVFFGVLSIEDFGSNATKGIRAAYHIDENAFFEVSYGMSEGGQTSHDILGGGPQLLTSAEREYTYYNASAGYNLPGETFFGERAFNTDLYLIAGIGSTEFAGDDRFTVNVGFGYRLILNDLLAAHIDIRDHMFDIDVIGINKTAHNFEFTGGLTFFF